VRAKYALSAGFLACIVGANWALSRFGVVPIGFGLMAPAGVYFAGLSFGLRDAVQEDGGRRWVVGLILAGAALSWWIEPAFAVASATAFLLSELADFAVYTPLRERQWVGAVVASNAVGAVVDSAVFLWLAFGSLEFLTGQVVGKLYMTALAIPIVWWARQRRVAQ
jgi:uncharacterized PurR-regulated membrane protein YhhQ (DUF165 family)